MRLRHIEIFNAVMQCGSVKGAAEVLHITQPAASRLLQQAEAHIGLALFARERGRLVPTMEAQALFVEVDKLYVQLDGIRRLVAGLALGPAGMLRVLCVPSLSEHWLTLALAHVKQQHPKAKVSVRTLYSPQIADSLARREADVGFAFQAAQHPAVQSTVIAQGELMCFGAVRGRDITLEAVARQPVIDLDPTDPLGRLVHAACDQQGVVFSSSVLSHNYQTAVTMARRGLGLALIDSFTGRLAAADAGPAGKLRCVPVRPHIPVAVHALRPQGAASSVLVEHLIEDMKQRLSVGGRQV